MDGRCAGSWSAARSALLTWIMFSRASSRTLTSARFSILGRFGWPANRCDGAGSLRRIQPTDPKISAVNGRAAADPGLGWRSGLVRGGMRLRGLGDGDGVAEERFDLPDMVFDLLVFVGAGLVVAGAEVGEPGRGVGEQVPDDDQDGAGDGDWALVLPRRRAIRWYRSPRKVAVRAAPLAAWPRAPRSQVLPWPFLPARVRGPDWRADGHSPAQDTRWAAVGNRDMSRPISPMTARALCCWPGHWSNCTLRTARVRG